MRNPAKFAGSPAFVRYFYALSLDWREAECAHTGASRYAFVVVTDHDRSVWGDALESAYAVVLVERFGTVAHSFVESVTDYVRTLATLQTA